MPLPNLAFARQPGTGPLCRLSLSGSAPLNSTRSPPKPGSTELEGRAGLVHHFLWIEIHAKPGAFDLAVEFNILFVAGQSGLARCGLLGKEKHCRRNEPFFVALVAD